MPATMSPDSSPDLDYKNVESLAYLHDHERQPLPQFIGQSPWNHDTWLAELTRQVGQQLGRADAVLVFDPSAFANKGNASVGVQRQWCGRLGKIDNCQVGVDLGYVGGVEHALVDVRLHLPKEWAKDQKRCRQAGVPVRRCRRPWQSWCVCSRRSIGSRTVCSVPRGKRVWRTMRYGHGVVGITTRHWR
ncbi:MAG: transposase [Gemmataceae bacterium]